MAEYLVGCGVDMITANILEAGAAKNDGKAGYSGYMWQRKAHLRRVSFSALGKSPKRHKTA